jgi:hypothetical protein
MEQPYQFAFHDRVSKTAPSGGNMGDFFQRLASGGVLTRAEKNTVFHTLQGNSRKTYYRIMGWVFPFKQFLKRYLVKYDYESSWTEIWAFDKTCIRESYYTKNNIVEIVLFPEK